MAQRKAATQPQPTAGTQSATVVTLDLKAAGTRKSIFDVATAEITEKVAQKAQVMGQVRQQLAMAHDLYEDGADKATEARATADKAGVALYQARCLNLITNDEISSALGDQFGYKPKKDMTPGKTPAGEGEALRKRIVRAVSAFNLVNDGDGGAFFEGLDPDSSAEIDGETRTVEDTIARVGEGQLSLWAAYDTFAKIKAASREKTDIAFDAKRIAGIVESLSQDGAPALFRDNPALVKVYAALRDMIDVVGEAAMVEPETTK